MQKRERESKERSVAHLSQQLLLQVDLDSSFSTCVLVWDKNISQKCHWFTALLHSLELETWGAENLLGALSEIEMLKLNSLVYTYPHKPFHFRNSKVAICSHQTDRLLYLGFVYVYGLHGKWNLDIHFITQVSFIETMCHWSISVPSLPSSHNHLAFHTITKIGHIPHTPGLCNLQKKKKKLCTDSD